MIKSIQFQVQKQARAYSLMFIIENMLRVSMHSAMVKKKGATYFNEASFPEYEDKEVRGLGKPINVVKDAKDRKNTEQQGNLWLGKDYPYLWYVDFSILVSMLDQFGHQFFDVIFVNARSKRDILSRLKNVYPIRNAIAHARYLSDAAISELETLSASMEKEMVELHLDNFSDIALNSTEGLILTFRESCEKIRTAVQNGDVISRGLLREFRSKFSALLSNDMSADVVDAFLKVETLLGEYNQLPRKPGRAREISDFVKSSGIMQLLTDLQTDLR
jgi:hypothetical protein